MTWGFTPVMERWWSDLQALKAKEDPMAMAMTAEVVERRYLNRLEEAHAYKRHQRPHPDCPTCKLNANMNRTEAASKATNAIAGIWSPHIPKGFRR
jgi:hypothetical protein